MKETGLLTGVGLGAGQLDRQLVYCNQERVEDALRFEMKVRFRFEMGSR